MTHAPRLLIASLLALSSGEAAAQSPLAPSLEPGPYPVGWRVESIEDPARPFACEPAIEGPPRPIRLLVWYPATDSDAPRLRYGDYARIEADDPYGRALVERDLSTIHRQFAPPDSALTRRLLDVPVPARAAPPPAHGRHPVVVHALGRNDYQQEATVLWENLASHGYVVVVPPQMGPCPDTPRLDFDAPSIALQAVDLAAAIEAAAGWPWADTSRTAIVGHSSGAVVALEAAADPRVAAIVSLDGSIATAEGGALLREIGIEPVGVPILDLQAAGHPDRDTAVLDSLARGPIHRWVFGTGTPPTQATHFDFQNWPLFATWGGVVDERGARSRPPDYGHDVWTAAIRLTRAFLDQAFAGGDALEGWRAEPPAWLSAVASPTAP